MGVHMDFHFRQNKRNMEKGKKMLSRDWYVPVENWIANKEVEVGEEHAPYFGDAPEAKKEKVETEELPKVRAPEGEALVCPICHEKFVRYWDEDEEEWMVRDAVEVDGRVGKARSGSTNFHKLISSSPQIRHYTCHREVAGGGSRARSNSPEPGSLAGRVRSPAVQSGLPKRARTEVDDRESKKLKP